jgi:hypothetical protein
LLIVASFFLCQWLQLLPRPIERQAHIPLVILFADLTRQQQQLQLVHPPANLRADLIRRACHAQFPKNRDHDAWNLTRARRAKRLSMG